MERKVVYTCKNCGREYSIREEWGDLRPKRCVNKKCNISFINNPDMVTVTRPEPLEVKEVVILKEEESDGKNSKKKRSS